MLFIRKREKSVPESSVYERFYTTEGFVKNLNEYFKRGHMPNRYNEEYLSFVKHLDSQTYKLVNCVGHAFINANEKDILDLKYNFVSENILSDFFKGEKTYANAFRNVCEFFERVGLKIEKTTLETKPDFNQWKVACYFKDLEQDKDYHFMLQEKDGSWSSKRGFTIDVEHFDELPQKHRNYELEDIIMVTNPFIENEADKIEEERE